MREKVGFIWLIVLVGTFALTSLGWANMANPYQEGDQVGEPTGDLRSVAIEHEALVMDLKGLAQDGPALVTATYDVRNDGATKRLNLLFVATALAPNQGAGTGVWLDNQKVASSIRSAPLPPSWQPPKTTPGIGSNPDLPYYAGNGVERGILFTLQLPSGAHQIRVAYQARASAVATQSSPVRYWQLGYVLSPARNWESFGKLDLEIDLPPAWSLVSSLNLARSGDVFKGSFNGIPADTIGLTVQAPVPPEPVNFDVTPFVFVVGIGLSVGIGIAVGRFSRRRGKSSLWAVPIGFVFAVAWAVLLLASTQVANAEPVVPPLQYSWIYHYGATRTRVFEGLVLAILAFPVGLAVTSLAAYLAGRKSATVATPTGNANPAG